MQKCKKFLRLASLHPVTSVYFRSVALNVKEKKTRRKKRLSFILTAIFVRSPPPLPVEEDAAPPSSPPTWQRLQLCVFNVFRLLYRVHGIQKENGFDY